MRFSGSTLFTDWNQSGTDGPRAAEQQDEGDSPGNTPSNRQIVNIVAGPAVCGISQRKSGGFLMDVEGFDVIAGFGQQGRRVN